jgi:hypothetical protein
MTVIFVGSYRACRTFLVGHPWLARWDVLCLDPASAWKQLRGVKIGSGDEVVFSDEALSWRNYNELRVELVRAGWKHDSTQPGPVVRPSVTVSEDEGADVWKRTPKMLGLVEAAPPGGVPYVQIHSVEVSPDPYRRDRFQCGALTPVYTTVAPEELVLPERWRACRGCIPEGMRDSWLEMERTCPWCGKVCDTKEALAAHEDECS